MKVTPHRTHRRILAPTILFLISLCALAFNGAKVSVADNFQERTTVAAGLNPRMPRPPTPPKPDCDLEFPSRADSDVRHNNCLNKIKGKLDEKLRQTPDKRFIILIDGHRDSKDQEGQTLSRSRAEKVGDYLVNNPDAEIDADLIKVRDLNDLCPPEKSSKHNRRVQVWIVPEETDLLIPLTKCAPGSKAKPVSNPPNNLL